MVLVAKSYVPFGSRWETTVVIRFNPAFLR